MKTPIRLCDFWAIYEEEILADSVQIVGILPGDDRVVVATFPRQAGPRGSWETTDWYRKREGETA